MSRTVTGLASLAKEANDAHAQAQAFYRRGVEQAIRSGKALIRAKAKLPHGEWGRWLDRNFDGSERTAQLYMRMARFRWDLDDETRNAVAELTLREAAERIAQPRSIRVIHETIPGPVGRIVVTQEEFFPRTAASWRANKLQVVSPPETEDLKPEQAPTCTIELRDMGTVRPGILADLARSFTPETVVSQLVEAPRSVEDVLYLADWCGRVSEALRRQVEAGSGVVAQAIAFTSIRSQDETLEPATRQETAPAPAPA